MLSEGNHFKFPNYALSILYLKILFYSNTFLYIPIVSNSQYIFMIFFLEKDSFLVFYPQQ